MRAKARTSTWLQVAFLSACLAFCAGVTTWFCICIDEGGVMHPAYWGFMAMGVVPVGIAFGHFRVLPLWFLFGLWAGSLALLPFVPWSPCKRFFTSALAIEKGMTLETVRERMSEFDEYVPERSLPVPGHPEQAATPRLDHFLFARDSEGDYYVYEYAWDPYGISDLDRVTVYVLNDRVVRVDVERD